MKPSPMPEARRPGLLASMLVLLGLCLAACAQAAPARRALLIGAAHYNPPCPLPPPPGSKCQDNNLYGPVNDVERLKQDLKDRFGFTDDEIIVLVDGHAVKAAVLKALDDLAAWARPGAEIFIYYAGHGTSNLDKDAVASLPDATGALVLPSPVQPPPSSPKLHDLVQSQFLIGSKEIRPLLQRMDRAGADVIAIVDACFSENIMRGAGGGRRYTLPEQVRAFEPPAPAPVTIGQRPQGSEAWPYAHVAWLSAASADEPAAELLPAYRPTVDGKAHGALTDALLRVLESQEAFTDADGRHQLSYAELFKATADYMRRAGDVQTPRVMPSKLLGDARTAAVLDLPVFGKGLPVTPLQEAAGERVVKISLSGQAAQLRSMLAQLPGIEFSSKGAEYRIEPAARPPGYWSVWTGGQEPLLRDSPGAAFPQDTDTLRASLRLRGWLRQLTAQARLRSTGLSLEAGPADGRIGGTVRSGEPLTLKVKASRDVTVALLHLMGDGSSHIWIPSDPYCPGAAHVKANTPTELCTWPGAAPPYGLDLLYVIAASGGEPALEAIKDTQITPAVEHVLQQVVTKHAGPVAMAELALFTVDAR
jgi:hypothetical protein